MKRRVGERVRKIEWLSRRYIPAVCIVKMAFALVTRRCVSSHMQIRHSHLCPLFNLDSKLQIFLCAAQGTFLDTDLINLGDRHAARIEEYDDQTCTRCLMGIGPV